MGKSFTERKRIRKSFGRIREAVQMPNLIEVQRASYDGFLQKPDDAASGLEEVFKSVFPIKDFSDRSELQFVRYELEAPKYDEDECMSRGLTFAAPLKVTLRLVVWDVDEDTGSRSVLDIKEQDVYMGDMPLMTGNGTFIINGTERVIVSQMHRSPGVFCSTTTAARRTPRASCCSLHGSSRTAVPGSILNSTPRTCSTSVSTAAGSCRPPRC